MKSKKMMKKIIVIGMTASMIGLIVGCQSVGEHTKAPDAAEKTENNSDVDIDTENTNTGNTDTGNTDIKNTDTENQDTKNEDTGNADTENTNTGNTDTGKTNTKNTDIENQDTEIANKENTSAGAEKGNTTKETGSESAQEELKGTVESTDINSVMISKIFVEDMGDGGLLAFSSANPEDEELITIYFNDTAEYEFKTVKNGGADVESRKGAFADIKEGMILDMTGDWDGDYFYADQVVISEIIH